MATTVKISDTLNWITAFLVQRPTTGVGGITNEPGLTSANLVMQSILAPPFKWEWNRKSATAAITTVAGTSDYTIALSDFGYLEKATLVNPAAVAPLAKNFELNIFKVLSNEGKQNRPQSLAILLDDNTGNITFRLFPVPDLVYTVDLLYQKAAILATTLGNTTWTPIPDKFAFLYERGLLAQLQGMYNGQLYAMGMELFFRQLVAAAEGLTETEKNIFLEDSLRSVKMRAAEITGIQQGKAART